MAYECKISLSVNGSQHELEVEPRLSLADALRHNLGLTGTHLGCEHGMCGACTVWLDGKSVRSCLLFAAQAEGAEITTIEGLGVLGVPLQEAFSQYHALQCGFCTPGMIMSAAELLERNPSPSDDDVKDWLGGNICRCTGYQSIIQAVLAAAETPASPPPSVAASGPPSDARMEP